MLNIGCHLSSSKGFLKMGEEALRLGANTFQFFLRNPRGGAAKEIDPADAAALRALLQKNAFAPVMAHASYTLNPAAADPDIRRFAGEIMADDLARLERFLPHQLYNFHPGSHVGQGAAKGIELTAALLNRLLTPDLTTTVLLETMSGKGSEIGASFEEIAAIRARLKWPEKTGVCLDTCHIFSAGYDVVERLDETLETFDRVIGLDHLKAVHLNDSLTPFASHKDRHAVIDGGSLGGEALVKLITHPRLKHLPFILETPNEAEGYAREIAFFRQRAAALSA